MNAGQYDGMTKALEAIRRDVARLAEVVCAQPKLIAPYVEPAPAGENTIALIAKRDRDGDVWVSPDSAMWHLIVRGGETDISEFAPFTELRVIPLTS